MSENSRLRSITAILPRRALRVAGGIALLAVSSCSEFPATASVKVPPIPAGEARVWFYREEGPYESQVRPAVRMNDAVVGEVEPRGAFYRDEAPGHYRVAVDSYVPNPNAARDIDLVAGQQVYFKIVSEEYPLAGAGMSGEVGASRATFQVWLMPAGSAQGEIARSPFYGSR